MLKIMKKNNTVILLNFSYVCIGLPYLAVYRMSDHVPLHWWLSFENLLSLGLDNFL